MVSTMLMFGLGVVFMNIDVMSVTWSSRPVQTLKLHSFLSVF